MLSDCEIETVVIRYASASELCCHVFLEVSSLQITFDLQLQSYMLLLALNSEQQFRLICCFTETCTKDCMGVGFK